jgi:hypothetical protein
MMFFWNQQDGPGKERPVPEKLVCDTKGHGRKTWKKPNKCLYDSMKDRFKILVVSI